MSRSMSSGSVVDRSRTARRHSNTQGPGTFQEQALRRRVCFCPTPMNQTHVITPYSTVYGKHPALFNFTREGHMRLTSKGLLEEHRNNTFAIEFGDVII